MSNTSKGIKNSLFDNHKKAFEIILETFNEFKISYYLIGAQARDVHFLAKGIKPTRGTRDIDFAIMMQDIHQYNELKGKLVAKGFIETKDPFRLNFNLGETVIDLLPFGEIEEDYTINFDQRDLELSVLGFRELNKEKENHVIDDNEDISIPVPPLHGIFLLKLLSWDDTKPNREKDLLDINLILNNYWTFIEDEAYSNHTDLFTDDFTTQNASARILGRKLQNTMKSTEVLSSRIKEILTSQIKQENPDGLMLRTLASKEQRSIEDIKSLLQQVLDGINDHVGGQVND